MTDVDRYHTLTAREVIEALSLKPHPEGGYYLETYRDEATYANGRAASSQIYYLLDTGDVSAWHRIDVSETWHYYAGGPLVLTISTNGHDAESILLGPELKSGQRPQYTVPPKAWQTATSLGAWTLVGCTVAPAFEFAGFELAPKDWRPTPRQF